MQKAVIYVRVSSKSQNNDRQVSDLISYSEEKHLTIVKIFSDIISGSKKKFNDREQFNLMVEYVNQNQIRNILVSEISRISRQLIDFMNFIEYCNTKLINIYFQKEKISTLDAKGNIDYNSQVIIFFLSAMAKQETDTLSYRIKSGKRSEALKGKSYHGQLYGYDKIDGMPVINKEEAIVVKKMFEMLLQGFGCRKIANYLNENEVSKKIWSSASIHSVVTNPFFKGKRYSSGIPISVDPIISEQEFDDAQAFIKSRFRFVSDSKHINPFASFIKCKCGATFTQIIIPSNRSNLYKCSASCGIASINRPYLISEIKSLLENNAKLVKDKQERIKFNLQIKTNNATIVKNQNRLTELEKSSNKILDLFTSEKITEKKFDEALIRYENEILKLKEVNSKLNEINKAISNSLKNEILHYSNNLEIFKSQLLPILESIVIEEKFCIVNMKGFSNINGLSSTKGFSDMHFYIYRGHELQLYRNYLKKHGSAVGFKSSISINDLDQYAPLAIEENIPSEDFSIKKRHFEL